MYRKVAFQLIQQNNMLPLNSVVLKPQDHSGETAVEKLLADSFTFEKYGTPLFINVYVLNRCLNGKYLIIVTENICLQSSPPHCTECRTSLKLPKP